MKEHDLILSLLANPTFSANDFLQVGYTVDNTEILDEDKYKDFKVVRENFKKDDGTFDNDAFHTFYSNVLMHYNATSQQHNIEALSLKYKIEDLYKYTSWKANDVLAPDDAPRRQGPDITFGKILNPDRSSWGTSTLGKYKEGTESTSEIAQSNKVLANPVDVEKGAAPVWHNSPNDSFWTDFWDTRVLAIWDYDADANGKKTNDPNKIVYQKGQLKLNDKGEPYYENLQGRDVYGRQVLLKLNTLTVDGSDINQYDFFDSDDKLEKSIGGTLLKNLALVGTMFIPYVGPVIAGASMGTQVAGMVAKLGKMISGSDNPTLSAIEGWTESWNRQLLKSEYAQNNTWCWENIIDVVGDLVGQLREQRMIFEYVPAIFKGAKVINFNGFSKEAEGTFLKLLTEQWLKKNSTTSLLTILRSKEGTNLALDLNKLASASANMTLRKYMKDYYRIGEPLSKMYMAGLISGNIYNEAKANGVSDEDAAWMTFGRFAAEMALLYTPMGNAILPELRANNLANKAMFQSAVDKAATFAKVNQGATTTANKMARFKKLFGLGAKLADTGAERVYANNIADTFKASLANGFEVGLVNDIEEFLNDVAKTVYNSISDDSKPKLESWGNMFDRYGMGMVSGLVGGTLTSAFGNYRQIQQARATTPELAVLQMVYLERQGELDKVLRSLDNETLGDVNLSATKYDTITDPETGEEKIIWKAGTKDDNQDLAAKQAIRMQANLIKQILNGNGINLSDETLLRQQDPELIKEIKFGLLQKSFAAARLLLKFNSACSDIVRLTAEINNATPKTDAKKAAAERGEIVLEQTISEKKKLLNEAIKIKDDILNGKYRPEFVRDLIYEMSPLVNHGLIKPSFIRYAEYVKKKPINQIPENELQDLKEKWQAWKETDMKDYLHIAAGIHLEIASKTADVVRRADKIFNENQDPVLQAINDFYSVGFNNLVNARLFELSNAQIEITPEVYGQVTTEILDNIYNKFGKVAYEALNTPEHVAQLNELISEYNSIRNDETKIDRFKELEQQIETIINDNFTKNLGKIITPILERGYINSEVRNNLINILLDRLELFVEARNKLNNLVETEANKAKSIELQKTIGEFNKAINDLQALPHSPIEELLNQFSITAKGEELNVTELLGKLDRLLKGVASDPSALLLGNEISEQISQAIQLLDVFEAVVEGAKKDAGQLNNILGYNHYLNLLMPETNAPEISTESGNVLIQDINTLRNKLLFYKDLNAQNQALKIGTNNRILLNLNYLTYNRLKSIKIPESWKNVEKWKDALASAEILEQNLQKKTLGLSKEAKESISKEMLSIQEALFELINDNIDNLEEFFSLRNFNYFDSTKSTLTESTEALNDARLLGWIIDSAALRFSSFKKMLSETRDGKIAPITPQELAVYKQLARIVNGKFYKTAYDIIRKNILKYWKDMSKDERIDYLKRIGKPIEVADIEDILDALPSLRYLNEIFTEGIPGSGKTNAVLPITLKILQNNYKHLLKNVAYIHGGGKESATNNINVLKDKFGIDTPGFSSYGKEEFLKVISDYVPYTEENGLVVIPESRMSINEETGEVRSSDNIKFTDNPFTLIIFDEATNANVFEHDVIDKYGSLYGTVTLAFGDLDQDGSYGTGKVKGNNYKFEISPTNFFPGFKLGVSMRANNTQKSQNLKASQNWVNEDKFNPLQLHYFEDETGIYGEKVIIEDPNSPDTLDNINQAVLTMINTLKSGEKIGFITNNVVGEIYQELSLDKYKDKVEIFNIEKRSPQGLEALYYIVDIIPEENEDGDYLLNKNFKRHIYTALSRSIQGTLIIDNIFTPDDRKIPVYNNIQDSETIKQDLPTEQIQKLSDEDSKFWSEIVKDAEIPEILNYEITNELPKPDNPVVNEGNGEVQVEVIPTLEKELEVLEKIIEESKVDEPEYKVIEQDNGVRKIDLCYYTFNKFEMGIEKGKNDEAIQYGNDPVRHKMRIDSANGLMNMDGIKGRNIRTFNEYRIILDKLHAALLNAKDIADLHNKIDIILEEYNFDFKNFSIKFGFKSSAKPPKNELRQFSSDDGSIFTKYDKYEGEETQYIHANDTKSKYITNKSVVLIIGNEQGDFLEIPYIQLPHVGTVIDKLSEKASQGDPIQAIKAIWDRVKSDDDAVGELLNNMSDAQKIMFPDLVKLGYIFRVTNNLFIDLGNWNSYDNLTNLGIQGVYGNRGQNYGIPGYDYDVPFIPISQLAQNTAMKVTPILYSKTADISDGTNTYENVIIPGLPFVLISYDPNITNITRTWLEETKTKPQARKVLRVYVVPPRASIDSYFDNLINILEGNKSEIEDIGNDVTAYNLTKILLADSNFREKVILNLKNNEFEKLDKLIDSLKNLNKKDLVAKLQTVPEGETKIYKSIFRLFLKELVKPTGQVIVNYKGFNSAPNRQLIVSTLENAGITGVYYQVRPPKSGEVTYGQYFYQADLNNKWEITNTLGQTVSYLIHGKIDSNVYQGDSTLLDLILDGLSIKSNQGSYDTYQGNGDLLYLNGHYALSSKNLNVPEPKLKVGDRIIYNNREYIISKVNNGKYDLVSNFGRTTEVYDVNDVDSSYAVAPAINSVYKIGDTIINPTGTQYTVISLDSNNYLLRDSEGNETIENIKFVDNWNNQVSPQTKYKVGDRIIKDGIEPLTIVDISESPGIGWNYIFDNNSSENIETVDSTFDLYVFSPHTIINGNTLTVELKEGLKISAELPQNIKDDLSLTKSKTVESNSDNSIDIEFENGSKIHIEYDEDSSSHLAQFYSNLINTPIYTEEQWTELKQRVSPDVFDLIDVPLNEINMIEEVIDEIEQNNDELISNEDLQLMRNMLEDLKKQDPCMGVNLTFK